ncbi:hypothetical protein G7Z17_g3900 [Cylindrodendrum hubeiense]|uniref:Acyltransferase 3 domain-containing protein n=1 Tax=Cylindrodendrum hubeiense TaxID=595255 RepID=A0A9P5HDR6_9HYPO|nr:hypothetical protein G7Z17_g3900 [Cylindrodendrum hubeiense]
MNGHSLDRLSLEENRGLLNGPHSPGSDGDQPGGILVLDRHSTNSTWSRHLKSPVECLLNFRFRATAARIAWFCVPSFLQGRQMREQIRPAKLSPTAYLDGMRGLAALFVYFCHYGVLGYVVNHGYGWQGKMYDFWRLPFLRLWYSGPPAVSVFFVISGYALSYKPIRLMRSRKTLDFSTTMSSMIFRRAIRLFLPTTIATFMWVCLIRMGVYNLSKDLIKNRKYFRKGAGSVPPIPASAIEHFVAWGKHIFYSFTKVFDFMDRGALTKYDGHLWTIPVEYRCSLYLFLVLCGTARLQTKYRYLTVFAAMSVTYRQSRWDFLMFLCGMALAEWDHIRGAHVKSPALPLDEKVTQSSVHRLKPILWNLFSIVALYLMSQPDGGGEETPGWVYLTSQIPEWWQRPYRYWQSIGSVMFILAVGYSAFWRRVFNSGLIQYLGKISYSLYIVHGPVGRMVGFHLQTLAWNITGVEGKWWDTGFVLGGVFSLAATIFFADIFWRAIDVPTVQFARWFESKVNIKED